MGWAYQGLINGKLQVFAEGALLAGQDPSFSS